MSVKTPSEIEALEKEKSGEAKIKLAASAEDLSVEEEIKVEEEDEQQQPKRRIVRRKMVKAAPAE